MSEINAVTLIKGRRYAEGFIFVGWTEGDGSGHEGYNVPDYFRDWEYLGPDEHGIEPLFVLPEGDEWQ